nr:ATPase PAAT-like [Saimiri boliviensis boliviensis]
METRTEDGGLTRRPTLAWFCDATGRALTHNLLLTRAGLSAHDFWEELQAPPAPGCAGPTGTGSLCSNSWILFPFHVDAVFSAAHEMSFGS